MSRCTCDTYELTGFDREKPIVVERERDPDCLIHGYPDDKWRVGDPLEKHAKVIEEATGRVLTREEAHAIALAATREADAKAGRAPSIAADAFEWQRRFRNETPREVEARLLRELAA